ncbi:MAG: hypothetical protein [Bacteriophage sp.]|nr:MAG: hypothetical protein [Bacteriophage sp.]
MIKDQTIDQALIELKRTEYALLKLRAKRRMHDDTARFIETGQWTEVAEHSAVKRASLDLTGKLADLRAGR